MDYKGEWGGGGPGHSWALGPGVLEPILLCCIVMEISTGWGRFWGGGERFDPSLAVR